MILKFQVCYHSFDGTIKFSEIEDSCQSYNSYDIGDSNIHENYGKVYFRHILPFNDLWKPNWKKLYDRFIKFQTDHPDFIEWPLFSHSKKLQFIIIYDYKSERNSDFDYPNEYSNFIQPNATQPSINDLSSAHYPTSMKKLKDQHTTSNSG